jgi:hypothetical protein
VTASPDVARQRLLAAAFQMPSVQTMVSRKSSITNAFVNSVIPVIQPTLDEIDEALSILGMGPADVRCVYCGALSTEWDHLRPLVLNQRPTGFISEIGNLVPACGKCNQSKGNKDWRIWMLSAAKRSPTGLGLPDVAERISRLEKYERWRAPTKIDFESILGRNDWEGYWRLWHNVNEELRRCHDVAETLRTQIAQHLKSQSLVHDGVEFVENPPDSGPC